MCQEEYKPYAYLCNTCCAILELPCFVKGICPDCGSESKEILYKKVV